jgi:hypothetical protein
MVLWAHGAYIFIIPQSLAWQTKVNEIGDCPAPIFIPIIEFSTPEAKDIHTSRIGDSKFTI